MRVKHMRARTHIIQNAHLVERAAAANTSHKKHTAVILCDACELLMIKMGQKIISAVQPAQDSHYYHSEQSRCYFNYHVNSLMKWQSQLLKLCCMLMHKYILAHAHCCCGSMQLQCDFSIGKRTSGNPTSSNNDIELFRKFENFGFSGRGAEWLLFPIIRYEMWCALFLSRMPSLNA